MALLARYKNGQWGYVAFPRRVPLFSARVPKKSIPATYDRVRRRRATLKAIGWPFGRHSLRSVQDLFAAHLPPSKERDLVIEQADVYVKAFKNNIINCSPRMMEGSVAFLRLWQYLHEKHKSQCRRCRKSQSRCPNGSCKG